LFFQEDNTLLVIGDDGPNEVALEHRRERGISVQCDGEARTFMEVTQIELESAGGDDRVSVIWSDPPEPEFVFRADLGAGNDAFEATFADPPDPDADPPDPTVPPVDPDMPRGIDPLDPSLPASFEVVGGSGSDAFNIFVGNPDENAAITGDLDLNLSTGGGDDSASVMVQNSEIAGSLDIAVDTGAGNDVATVGFDEVDIPGSLHVAVNTGAGNDLAALGFHEVDEMPAPDRGFSSVLIEIQGGGGHDNILAWVGFNPQPDPPGSPRLVDFVLRIDGGEGNDLVAALVDLTNLGEAARIQATIEIFGSLGNDLLALGIIDPNSIIDPDQIGDPNLIDALVDGGLGFDLALVMRGVRVRNCEGVFPI
jgi:hypothetical protein